MPPLGSFLTHTSPDSADVSSTNLVYFTQRIFAVMPWNCGAAAFILDNTVGRSAAASDTWATRANNRGTRVRMSLGRFSGGQRFAGSPFRAGRRRYRRADRLRGPQSVR